MSTCPRARPRELGSSDRTSPPGSGSLEPVDPARPQKRTRISSVELVPPNSRIALLLPEMSNQQQARHPCAPLAGCAAGGASTFTVSSNQADCCNLPSKRFHDCETCTRPLPITMSVCPACWYEKWNAICKLGRIMSQSAAARSSSD